MSLLEILILAVVQGVTEFLPVSSSGHLVVVNELLVTLGRPPTKDLVEVNIALHLGTLLSIFVYYWRDIWRLLSTDRRVIPLLIIGTIPAVVVGLPLKKLAPDVLENPLLAGVMFFVTAALLVWAMRLPTGDGEYPQLTGKKTILIGMFQALALLPGVSRSGATIAAGIFVGLKRNNAATFAFLLAIPAILGAGLLEGLEIWKAGSSGTPLPTLAAGFCVAFVVGLAALWVLIRFVQRGQLAVFARYLIPLGVVVTIWQLVG